MIPAIFKDENLQQAFDENGYAIIPLLNSEEVKLLTEIFKQYHPDNKPNTFGSSSFFAEKDEKIKIKEALFPIFENHFNRIFKDFTYFGSSFLYKTKGKKSFLAPHQDWSIVDEKKFVALNIWTPLVDTNKDNGTLYVVPKSQAQKLFSIRAPTLPFYFQDYMNTVENCAVPTNAKVGEAVILNQSIIHFSSANRTDQNRIAITSGIKSKDAPMNFHFLNDQNMVERYLVNDDFFLDFENFNQNIYERPKNGVLIECFSPTNITLSKAAFLKKFPLQKSLWSRFGFTNK